MSVMLEDDDGRSGRFCEPDASCPYLCDTHARQNELESEGLGRSRRYPFSKYGFGGWWKTEGWTTYRSLRNGKRVYFADENGLPLD
ncbi:MAG: hypothetical protein QM736_16630 [Vicinamibacterales bacterium]